MKKIKKQKSKKSVATKKVARTKKYEAHYLALVLISFLMIEGALVSFTTQEDWSHGVAVLDVSQQVGQFTAAAESVISPINEFYQIAATEAAVVLDLSDDRPMQEMDYVASGVNDFFEQASEQLAQMLDLSENSVWHGSVAGASTVR